MLYLCFYSLHCKRGDLPTKALLSVFLFQQRDPCGVFRIQLELLLFYLHTGVSRKAGFTWEDHRAAVRVALNFVISQKRGSGRRDFLSDVISRR